MPAQFLNTANIVGLQKSGAVFEQDKNPCADLCKFNKLEVNNLEQMMRLNYSIISVPSLKRLRSEYPETGRLTFLNQMLAGDNGKQRPTHLEATKRREAELDSQNGFK